MSLPKRPQTLPFCGIVFVAVSILLVPIASDAANCTPSNGNALGTGNKIKLNNQSGSSFNTTINGGRAQWNNCSGDGIPQIVTSGSVNLTINVKYLGSQKCPVSGCACGKLTKQLDASNRLVGGTIRIYGRTNADVACPALGSNELKDTMAHELGHVLGLGHPSSGCSGRIMTGWAPGYDRSVAAGDCVGADSRWLVPSEIPGGGNEGHACSAPPP